VNYESRSPDGERATEQTIGDRPAAINAESMAKAEPGSGRTEEQSVITTDGGVKHVDSAFVQEGDGPANVGSTPADSHHIVPAGDRETPAPTNTEGASDV